MICLHHWTSRPPRSARVARALWDRVTEEDGDPPQSMKLMIDGRFRDWMFIRANGELDEGKSDILFKSW